MAIILNIICIIIGFIIARSYYKKTSKDIKQEFIKQEIRDRYINEKNNLSQREHRHRDALDDLWRKDKIVNSFFDFFYYVEGGNSVLNTKPIDLLYEIFSNSIQKIYDSYSEITRIKSNWKYIDGASINCYVKRKGYEDIIIDPREIEENKNNCKLLEINGKEIFISRDNNKIYMDLSTLNFMAFKFRQVNYGLLFD